MTKSIIRTAKTIQPVKGTIAFFELCRAQSKVYPLASGDSGPKLSTSRFLKQAAIEKLEKLGFKEYLKSII
jgi:beta-phosphoglucomutase-like phosphatase (HAD superfamily)